MIIVLEFFSLIYVFLYKYIRTTQNCKKLNIKWTIVYFNYWVFTNKIILQVYVKMILMPGDGYVHFGQWFKEKVLASGVHWTDKDDLFVLYSD